MLTGRKTSTQTKKKQYKPVWLHMYFIQQSNVHQTWLAVILSVKLPVDEVQNTVVVENN